MSLIPSDYAFAERRLAVTSSRAKLAMYSVLFSQINNMHSFEEVVQARDTYHNMRGIKPMEPKYAPQAPAMPAPNPMRSGAPWLKEDPGAAVPGPLQVLRLQQALAEAEAALAAENKRNELAARIDSEMALAEATRTLLADIRVLLISGNAVHPRKEFAKYRKDLSALASTYGVKIVPVGDKSAATLTINN